MAKAHRKLVDPHLTCLGGIVYLEVSRRLRVAGEEELTPDATAQQVAEAAFSLMTREDRECVDRLRLTPRRLCVDFFMYDVADGDELTLDGSLWERPVPSLTPRWEELGDIPIDVVAALADPAESASACSEPIDERPARRSPVNLGRVMLAWKHVLEK